MKFKKGDLVRHIKENEEWLGQIIEYHSVHVFAYTIITASTNYSYWIGRIVSGNDNFYKLVESTLNHPHTKIFK